MIDWEEWKKYNRRDWDGYNADPIKPETVENAKRLESVLHDLPADLNPAPGSDGTIGFEICWKDGRELWISIGPKETMEAYIPKRNRP